MTITSSPSSSASTQRRRARTSARISPSSASIAHLLPARSTHLPAAQPHLALLVLLLTCPHSAYAQYFYTNTRHELSPGAVAGIVVAAGVVVVFFLGMYLFKRRRQRRASVVLQRVNSGPSMGEQTSPRVVHLPEKPQPARQWAL